MQKVIKKYYSDFDKELREKEIKHLINIDEVRLSTEYESSYSITKKGQKHNIRLKKKNNKIFCCVVAI